MAFNFRLFKSLDEPADARISFRNGSWSNPGTKARSIAANGFWSKLRPNALPSCQFTCRPAARPGSAYAEGYAGGYEEIHGERPVAGREALNAKCQVVDRAFR